jgi:aspartate racemase
MHTFPFSDYMHHIEANDWRAVASLMLSSAEKVAKAGADFAICPDNTIHRAFDLVAERSPIPWLHIAEEVAKEAKHRNFSRVGILGTKFLMESAVYPEKLEAFGIEYAIPEVKDRERINGIIFNELVYGKFYPESRAYFCKVIERLKDQGCDAVVLGCTEIPLLVTEEESELPTLDSTRILAKAALKRALEG